MDKDKTSLYVMKKLNEQKVLNLIYKEGPISRVKLAERTNLTQQTITNIVRRLLEQNLIIESPTSTPTVGRNPINIEINKNNLYAIGLEIGVKKIRGVLVDFNKTILNEASLNIKELLSSEHTLNSVYEVIDALLIKAFDKQKIKGIGISIEGIVDKASGIVVNAPHLKWKAFKLKKLLENKYSLPVFIENDVNLISIVENSEGLLTPSQNNLTIKFDQGIGGAIVFNKMLYTGSRHIAGEFGHYKCFEGENELECHCGASGCLTTRASIGSMEHLLAMNFGELIYGLKNNNSKVKNYMIEIGVATGKALANIVTLLSLDTVLLTGRLIDEAGYLLLPIIEKQVKNTVPQFCKHIIIKNVAAKNISAKASQLVTEQIFRSV